MSVKHALLALLSMGPATTYQLRRSFDESTGQIWPLNIGQASATLSRLERDGQVAREPSEDDDGTQGSWSLTDRGKEELGRWWANAVTRPQPERHELALKLALAVVVPGVDVQALIDAQRIAAMTALHDATRARRGVAPEDLPSMLVLDHHLATLEAELSWLEGIEATLARHRSRPTSAASDTEASPTARRRTPSEAR
ncbi:PadR family transcriptional regulator [Brachybacterium phenoliresistens]|uniref:PadR family transcriptional regulator n=1 Tax=Brachybacterium phenoliresistens TaxID=396014 RepID=Z9JU88_9MICO|nr:helix-turn-helix transcriptional regulator [Brachybacterium phenoliresistens]EWS81769.1 PadR family transcriptional regulator [Brachybacterium phenoliresistens]